MEKEKTSVIMSGSDTLIFNSIGATKKPVNRKFKVLTHHWSSNWMKGFELYLQLDKKLSEPTLKNKIEFTYIGNVDKKYEFSNTKFYNHCLGLNWLKKLKITIFILQEA